MAVIFAAPTSAPTLLASSIAARCAFLVRFGGGVATAACRASFSALSALPVVIFPVSFTRTVSSLAVLSIRSLRTGSILLVVLRLLVDIPRCGIKKRLDVQGSHGGETAEWRK
jgi:hypothetical protein